MTTIDKLYDAIACANDLKRAWGQEKRDQIAAGASAKTLQQIDEIILSIRHDLGELHSQLPTRPLPRNQS